MRWGRQDGISLGEVGEDQEFSLGPVIYLLDINVEIRSRQLDT